LRRILLKKLLLLSLSKAPTPYSQRQLIKARERRPSQGMHGARRWGGEEGGDLLAAQTAFISIWILLILILRTRQQIKLSFKMKEVKWTIRRQQIYCKKIWWSAHWLVLKYCVTNYLSYEDQLKSIFWKFIFLSYIVILILRINCLTTLL
jgi:hypothetical protein